MRVIGKLRKLCLTDLTSIITTRNNNNRVHHPTTAKALRCTGTCGSSNKHHPILSNHRRCLESYYSSTSGDHHDENASASSSSSSSSSLSILSSKRGHDAVKLLPSYLADARAVIKYSPDVAPNGALQLGVAESLLLEDWLVPALNHHQQHHNDNNNNNKIGTTTTTPTTTTTTAPGTEIRIPANAIYYQPTAGREDFRQTFASYIEEELLQLPRRCRRRGHNDNNNNNDNNNITIVPDNLVVGAGCNAVLENLCFVLAEQGDAVLIPTPYYAAFEFDLGARAGLVVVPVTTQKYHENDDNNDIDDDASTCDSSTTTRRRRSVVEDPSIYYPNTAALDAAFERAELAGNPPRILLISHPHNPLGICYPPHVIQECIDWCRSRQVHLISDEIYAGSVYRPELANFQSVLQLANSKCAVEGEEGGGGLGPYVHWVYALSKDFALSGLRVGAAYTENEEILFSLQKLNDLCQISSTTQLWTKGMMEHKQSNGELWVTSFRRENHRRLEDRCQKLTNVLDECDIPYLTPNSGLFVWLDLSEFLPDDPSLSADEKERQLYLRLVQDFGLLLTPGASMRNEQPGFFRCVFTAATDIEFALSLERFRKFAKSSRTYLV